MNSAPGRFFSRRWSFGRARVLGQGLALAGLASMLCCKPSATGEEDVSRLREVSVFDRGGDSFLRGQSIPCGEQPAPGVRAYPVFKSSKPLYGSARFGARRDEPDAGVLFQLALDESGGTGEGYDRLYFDLNRDGDLSNDAVRLPQRRPPAGAELGYSGIQRQVVFECLEVELDFGTERIGAVQIMPRFFVTEYEGVESHHLTLVRTRLYAADIRVGGKEYNARLGNDYLITGRLDLPDAALVLSEGETEQPWYGWWGGDRLKAAHRIDGLFYTFAATAKGDRLTVRPYQGELGVFAVGAGGRDVDELSMSGSLESRDLAVAVGEPDAHHVQSPVRECRLPVGDYLPSYLSLELGRLRLAVSQNYHSDGKPRDRTDRPFVHGIHIRKEQPFTLDFSNKPDVMFASPAREERIKLGDTLEVKAVLVDAPLDLMIRRLDDSTRTQTEDAEGRRLPYARALSLDPKVIVARANGEKVAEGVMPFG